jgi:hypothetical protein
VNGAVLVVGRLRGAACFNRDSQQSMTVGAPDIQQGSDDTYSASYRLLAANISAGRKSSALGTVPNYSASYLLRDVSGADVGTRSTPRESGTKAFGIDAGNDPIAGDPDGVPTNDRHCAHPASIS